MANKKVFRTQLATAGECPSTSVLPAITKLTPVVMAYRVTGDETTAVLNIYAGSLVVGAQHTHADATTLLVNSTTGFAANVRQQGYLW